MSAAKHTPGPWRHEKWGIVIAQIDGQWRQIGCVTGDAAMHGDSTISPEDIRNANAALFASGPDLLKALEDLLVTARLVKCQADNSGRTPYENWEEAVRDLRRASAEAEAAITKAKGGAQ